MRAEVPEKPVTAMPTASEAGDGAAAPALGVAAQQVDCECAPQIRGYEITGRLGHGGMGIVWRATQRSTRRPVALKLLGSGLFAAPHARLRFEREVQLTAKLEHPHVARVYESGVAEGVYFYAMELVDGVPLDAYVADRRLPRRQVLELMRLVCGAVQHAHQRGVIHRDLKPSNILVTAGGEPKVLDFGLAKALQPDADADAEGGDGQPVSVQGDVAGTPGFMSPEQAAGRPVDTRSDVYSLGVILYRLLTGRDPHGTTRWDPASFHRLATEDVVRPRTADRSIDRDMEALLLKALALDPDDRYATASGLARDLANYLAGDPLTAKRATLTYFACKRLRKHWLPATAALVVLGVLTGEAACSYRRLRVERDRFASSSLVNASHLHARGRDLDLAHLLAAAAVRAADTPQAREALIKLSADWPRLHQFLHVPGGRVDAVAVSPDGKWAISAGGPASGQPDHAVWVWDLETGQRGPTLRGHATPVTRLAFSPLGGRAASADAGGVIRLWDATTWTPLGAPLTGHTGAVHALAFSHDGKRLASGGVGPAHAGGPALGNAGEVCLWDLRDVRGPGGVGLIGPLTAHTTPVHALAFSRDDRLLASGGGAAGTRFRGPESFSVLVWDAESGRPLTKPLLAPEWPEHRLDITALAFHPKDPKYLVSASENGIVLVWDWAHGRLSENRAIGLPPPIRGIDSKAAASLPAGIDVAILDIAFRPAPDATGWQLLTASADGTVAVLEWSQQGYLQKIGPDATFHANPGAASHAAFARDGSTWAVVRSPADGDSGGQIAVGRVDAPVGGVDPASLPTAELMGRADRLANRALTPAERSRYLQGPAR